MALFDLNMEQPFEGGLGMLFSNPLFSLLVRFFLITFSIGFDLNAEPIHLEDEHHLFDLNMAPPFVGGLGTSSFRFYFFVMSL